MDLTNIYAKYKGLWVALKDDHVSVVASGERAEDVLREAHTKGLKDPILFKVPIRIMPQIGVV